MAKVQTIPAISGQKCDCCQRTHRKLHLVGGYWMGENCAEQYKLYKQYPSKDNYIWNGYERQYNKIHRMVTGN